MRMLVEVKIPNEEFNAAIRDGSIERKIMGILEDTKPEAVYFTEIAGQRAAILIVDLEGPSSVPRIAEPWFLSFNAAVEFHVVMSPEELGRAGIEKFGKEVGVTSTHLLQGENTACIATRIDVAIQAFWEG